MTSEVDRASQRLFGPGGLGVKNISIFPGSNPNVTAEQVAAQLNKCLDALEAGDYEVLNVADEDLPAPSLVQ